MIPVIGLLRAVNVGGRNQIKMALLREICEGLPLSNPRTYIQSGNVVFLAQERALPKLAARMTDAIEDRCGFRPDVFLRTAAEMRAIIAANPFHGRDGIDPAKLVVVCCANPLEAANLRAVKQAGEEFHVRGREMYIYYPEGQGKSKLSFAAVERGGKMSPGTARNWNTVTKLLEMANALAT